MQDVWDTPALVVDLEKMEYNIKRMAETAHKAGVKLRPHCKTHKSPYIALRQLEYGAGGITVAKIGEAEVMRRHGIRDILIAYPIIGRKKLERLEQLARGTDIITALDSIEAAYSINEVGGRLGRKLPVYVEVNTGLGRCGNEPGRETLELVEKLLSLSSIEVRGLMTHAGHSYKAASIEERKRISRSEGSLLVATKQLIAEQLGYIVPEVSVGSTPTAYDCSEVEGITEIRPGTYVFNDATMVALGLAQKETCALTVYATVVSRPSPDRAIIDAGSKTLTSDRGNFTKGFGFVLSNPEISVSWLSEEHGVIETPPGFTVSVGDVLQIVPNHVCPAVNLADELIGLRGQEVERIIGVEARGKNK